MDLYSAFIVVPHTQSAQVRITEFYLQITPYLPLPRKRSPDGASPDWGCGHLIAAYYSFIYPERMKCWVGPVGWPTADGLPTKVVTSQLQVERRTGKVRLSETDVLPLCRATNPQYFYLLAISVVPSNRTTCLIWLSFLSLCVPFGRRVADSLAQIELSQSQRIVLLDTRLHPCWDS